MNVNFSLSVRVRVGINNSTRVRQGSFCHGFPLLGLVSLMSETYCNPEGIGCDSHLDYETYLGYY